MNRRSSRWMHLYQTEGKLLTEHALAPVLKKDWPTTLEELEERTT